MHEVRAKHGEMRVDIKSSIRFIPDCRGMRLPRQVAVSIVRGFPHALGHHLIDDAEGGDTGGLLSRQL